MRIWFVFSLLFSMLVAIFAVMNSNVVLIKLYWLDYELSQSLVILFSAFLGALTATFLGVFSNVKSSLKLRELNSTIKSLEEKNTVLTNQMIELQSNDFNNQLKDTDAEPEHEKKDDIKEH